MCDDAGIIIHYLFIIYLFIYAVLSSDLFKADML